MSSRLRALEHYIPARSTIASLNKVTSFKLLELVRVERAGI
jgi:hypothetical protein